MEEALALGLLREAFVFLLATVVVVPLCHRLRISPVLGYLAAGVIIGPFGLRVVDDAEGIQVLAGLGIVFLLFAIGLELSLERLWAMRRLVFGLGLAQVLVTGAVIAAIAKAWGNSSQVAIVLGGALALSSTAVVSQLLVERKQIASRFGRSVFAVLLMQDLFVVPLLFLTGVFGQPGEGSIALAFGLAIGRAVVAIGAILALGRYVLRPLFRLAATVRQAELFVALSLLVILGTATITGLAGLSMALGAFLAGLLLAETEFRHQIETDIRPFRGLLLGLFFMTVGMGIDLAAVADRAVWVVISVLGLVALKAVIAGGLYRAFGLPTAMAVRAGLLLGEGGEFAFVVIGAALGLGLMPPAVGQFMLIVSALSMALTPLLDVAGERLAARLSRSEHARDLAAAPADVADLEGHAVIAGYGRVGQMVGKLLELEKVPFVALDLDAHRVSTMRRRGAPIFYGDATRPEVLERVGSGRAFAVVLTIDDAAATAQAVVRIRQVWPTLPILARTRDLAHSAELLRLGASAAVPEAIEVGLQLAGQTLQAAGTPSDAVVQLIDQLREAEFAELTDDT